MNHDTLKTHDEVLSLLRYTAIGASVTTRPIKQEDPSFQRSKWYEVTIKRHGREDLCVSGCYSLPARPEPIIKSVLQRLEELSRD